jgi:hypothetical protein
MQLRLGQQHRNIFGEKLIELGNLIVAGLAFSQLLNPEIKTVAMLAGLTAYAFFTWIGLEVMKGGAK